MISVLPKALNSFIRLQNRLVSLVVSMFSSKAIAVSRQKQQHSKSLYPRHDKDAIILHSTVIRPSEKFERRLSETSRKKKIR